MGGYEVLGKLGQGGMGVVYRARQTELDREVALKLLIDSGGPPTKNELTRFAREVRALARLSHPNIVRVLDYGQMEGKPFYAMELIRDAEPLNRVMKTGPLPIPAVVAIARQLLHALAAIHALGLIHRDLKPGNVMMDKAGRVTLMDFGLVKDMDASRLTRTGMTIGTPRYLSPEAVQAHETDGRTDLWALGVMLHEALTGRQLFFGESLIAISLQIVTVPSPPVTRDRPDCPQWLAELIAKLLVKDPQDRLPTAAAGLALLHAGLGEGEPEADAGAGPSADPIPSNFELPQSRVIAGLDVFREGIENHDPSASESDTPTLKPDSAAPASPSPNATPPASAPASPRPAVRRTLSVPVSKPPPEPTSHRVPALAAASAAALLLAFVALRPAPPTPAPSPSPVLRPPSPSTPSPAADDPAAKARAAVAAIRALDPPARIKEIHAELVKISGRWFKTPPHPSMIALRDASAASLRARLASTSLEPSVRALAEVRWGFFTSPTVAASDRLAAYFALNDLLDLELYCDTFGIAFPQLARSALCEGYGQLTRPALGGEPAAGYRLQDKSNHSYYIAKDPVPANVRLRDLPVAARFHTEGNAEESDLMRTIGEGNRINLLFDPGEPLDIPLRRVTALEISGITEDLLPNAVFELELSDGAGFKRMGIIRGDSKYARRWWHTVERSLLDGDRLAIRVRFRALPDMNTGREFAHLMHLQVHYKVAP